MRSMTTGRRWLRVAGVAAGCGLVLLAGIAVAVVDEVDSTDWDEGAKYGGSAVKLTYGPDGLVTAEFNPPPPPPSFASYAVQLVAGGASASDFAGNYAAAGIEAVSLRLKRSYVGATSAKVILSDGVALWEAVVDFPGTADQWSDPAVVVPLVRHDGEKLVWSTQNPKRNNNTGWANALLDVEYIGVELAPDMTQGAPRQYLSVDNFRLLGDGFVTDPADLGPLGRVLDYFDVESIDDLTEEQRNQDTDKDGMSDLDELLAGTDPLNPNSIFAARIVRVDADGVTLEWPAEKDGVYAVTKSATVDGDYQTVLNGGDVGAAETGPAQFLDPSTKDLPGPFFYRIIRKQ